MPLLICSQCKHSYTVDLEYLTKETQCPYCRLINQPTHPETVKQDSSLDKQEGGDHYKKGIQPVEYIHSNGLGFVEGNAIKYLTRYKRKGSPVEDLKKAIHYIQMQLELEYGIRSRIQYDAVPRD